MNTGKAEDGRQPQRFGILAMGGVKTLKVRDDEAGMRVDRWFRQRFPSIGHSRVQKWLRTGQVRIDGGRVKASARLQAGQQVRVPPL